MALEWNKYHHNHYVWALRQELVVVCIMSILHGGVESEIEAGRRMVLAFLMLFNLLMLYLNFKAVDR